MPCSQQQSAGLLLLSAFCAALVGYQAGVVASRRKKKQEENAEEERNGQQQTPILGMQHHRLLRQLIYDSTGRGFGVVKRVYVVPGGGPGSGEDGGYPPWTAQRVGKALQRYDVKYADTTAFLALGAGSMNASSARGDNGSVVFESTRIAEELARGGVPPGSIIADFASWDTVGNAWFARMAVEALLDIAFRHGDKAGQPHAAPPPPPTATASAVNETPPFSSPEELPYPGSSGGRGGGGDADAKRDDEERGVAAGFSSLPLPPPPLPPALGEGEEIKQVAVGRQEEEEEEEVGRGGPGGRGGARGPGRGVEGGEEKLPAARAGEAYGGGEMRKWMFDFKAKKARARRGPLNVTVFVSDFHAERMDAVFQWVFGLEPSLLDGKVTVTTVSIDTPVEMWASGAEDRQARQAHERKAADQARLLAKEISTVKEFQAFLVLGGHRGYFDLTHGRYRASPGGGWGGAS